MSRYEVIDSIVQKWLLKYGGDPSMYKNKTKAFDTLAVLVAKLVNEHVSERKHFFSPIPIVIT